MNLAESCSGIEGRYSIKLTLRLKGLYISDHYKCQGQPT